MQGLGWTPWAWAWASAWAWRVFGHNGVRLKVRLLRCADRLNLPRVSVVQWQNISFPS